MTTAAIIFFAFWGGFFTCSEFVRKDQRRYCCPDCNAEMKREEAT